MHFVPPEAKAVAAFELFVYTVANRQNGHQAADISENGLRRSTARSQLIKAEEVTC